MEKSDIVKDKKIAELELQKITEFQPRDELIYSQRQIIEGQLDRDFTANKVVFADARLQLNRQSLLARRSDSDARTPAGQR